VTTQMTIEELEATGERDLGTSDWRRVEQHAIDLFAEATGDDQWIHVDQERAAAGPFGGTVAHGYLSLSLLPLLMRDVLVVTGARMGVNYGIDKVRFTAPVPSGSEVRLHARLLTAEPRPLPHRRPDRGQGSGEAGNGGRGALPRLLRDAVRRRARPTTPVGMISMIATSSRP
jgi:acyl dehydratase